MRFIHLADCHLASPMNLKNDIGELIREKSWESFENIFASNKDVDFALVAGDLFERNFVSSKDFARIFKIFADFGKDIYYVTGNHDYFDAYNEVFLNQKPSNLHIFSEASLSMFEDEEIRVYGVSYRDRINSYDFPYQIKLDPNYFNILLAHADISPNPTNYLDLDPVRLSNAGFSYVALGHIHKPGKELNCYYPGSIEPMSQIHTGSYGYIRYEDGKVSHMDSSLVKFHHFEIDETDYSNQQELIDFVNDSLSDKINVIYLDIYGDEDIDLAYLRRGINGSFVEIRTLRKENLDSVIKLYPDSLLAKFNGKLASKDDAISKKALELGLDAILRTRQ